MLKALLQLQGQPFDICVTADRLGSHQITIIDRETQNEAVAPLNLTDHERFVLGEALRL